VSCMPYYSCFACARLIPSQLLTHLHRGAVEFWRPVPDTSPAEWLQLAVWFLQLFADVATIPEADSPCTQMSLVSLHSAVRRACVSMLQRHGSCQPLPHAAWQWLPVHRPQLTSLMALMRQTSETANLSLTHAQGHTTKRVRLA
jgi:hypothetical protein